MKTLVSYFKNFFSAKTKPIKLDGLKGVARIDAVFYNLIIEEKLPGMSVTILKNEKPILNKAYGYRNIEAKQGIDTSKTLFRIASISKCITGLAFARMVEEGILDWDDSFYKYVPDYPKKESDFTLRQLASHTAGIRAYKGKEYALNKPFSIEDSLVIFKNDALEFEPGKGYLYNSFDFVLLSLAMEKASGVLFQDYVKEKILDPLKMTMTFVPALTTKEGAEFGNQSEFYTKTATGFKKAIAVNNFYKRAGGGYLSTSEDIAKLGQELLDRTLLKEDSYTELLTAMTINGKSTYYGLGFQVSQDKKGKAFVGHVGNSVGAYSNLFVYPKEELVVAILINCTDPKIQDVLDDGISNLFDIEL